MTSKLCKKQRNYPKLIKNKVANQKSKIENNEGYVDVPVYPDHEKTIEVVEKIENKNTESTNEIKIYPEGEKLSKINKKDKDKRNDSFILLPTEPSFEKLSEVIENSENNKNQKSNEIIINPEPEKIPSVSQVKPSQKIDSDNSKIKKSASAKNSLSIKPDISQNPSSNHKLPIINENLDDKKALMKSERSTLKNVHLTEEKINDPLIERKVTKRCSTRKMIIVGSIVGSIAIVIGVIVFFTRG